MTAGTVSEEWFAQPFQVDASSTDAAGQPPQRRGRGRPKGSLNKPRFGSDGLPLPKAPRKVGPVFGPQNRRGRPRKSPSSEEASRPASLAPPEANPFTRAEEDDFPVTAPAFLSEPGSSTAAQEESLPPRVFFTSAGPSAAQEERLSSPGFFSEVGPSAAKEEYLSPVFPSEAEPSVTIQFGYFSSLVCPSEAETSGTIQEEYAFSPCFN